MGAFDGSVITSNISVVLIYDVTSLSGTAKYLYESVFCQRGRVENLIKALAVTRDLPRSHASPPSKCEDGITSTIGWSTR